MILGALYHWSPAARYGLIQAEGLRPKSSPTVATQPQPYLCLAPDPAAAWEVSAAMEWVAPTTAWDLWQVRLSNEDEIHIRPEFGPAVVEVQVYGTIPPTRLWWCGRRPAIEPSE